MNKDKTDIIRLSDTTSPQYKEFAALYAKSFPVFEQRTKEQQILAFSSSHYHLDLYYEGPVFIGFIAYWQFDRYSYVEHFAVHDMHRGRGYGAQLLNRFVEEQARQVVLEIDPITDEISAARWRFYERCGFSQNRYPHIHPPYRNGYAGHSLVVLSSGGTLETEVYELFYRDLINVVMKF